MKTGRVALSTAEKEFGSAILENGSRRPRYREKRLKEPTSSLPPKRSPGAQNMKTGHDASVPAKTSMGAQDMKTGLDALEIAENESGIAKHDKRDLTPFAPPKMCPIAQNMKTGADAHETAENESGSAKHENRRLCPPHRQKLAQERKLRKRCWTTSVQPKMSTGTQNMKTGPDALGTAENESRSVNHENEI
jgi:hypothetical protein